MLRALRETPLILQIAAVGAAAMLVPALHAVSTSEYRLARIFLYSGLLFLFLTLLAGLASAANPRGNSGRVQLLTMLATFLLLPAMLAVPFNEAVADTGFTSSWWEMVSAMTTTGATLYDPERLAPSLHLWRALVGWMGGLFMLVMAIAVLAPLRLGGFEIFATGGATAGEAPTFFEEDTAEPEERIRYYLLRILPPYAGLTAALWLGLVLLGERSLVALCHAMSTLSTSGITPLRSLEGSASGIPGEMLIFLLLIPALSRRLWPGGGELRASSSLRNDPELWLAGVLVAVLTLGLFLRHWIAAFDIDMPLSPLAILRSLWGSAFTALSFLTTTGFASASWDEARAWSGLGTPGLVLAGLAIVGGGVATTAGGVRLLRVYALVRHGEREMIRLVHPAAVLGGGATARWLRRQGAYRAWIFFMLFAITVALVMAAAALTGLGFEPAMIMSIAALSNTGPLAAIAGDTALHWAELNGPAQFVFALAMVLGRLETLAIIALFNPELWRA